jgi:opacity protein-like surface antigen
MLKNIKISSIAALIFLLAATIFAGGGKRNGTAGAQELLIPTSALGMAMGSSYIAGISGPDAIFYNPAGVGVSEKSAEAMFSYMNYIADIGFSFAAVTVNFESFGTIGFSFRTIDFGDIPVTDERNPYGTGSTFSPNYVTLTTTYSNSLTDRIRVGVNFNVITEKIVSTSATGFGIDAGVQYSNVAGIQGLNFGLTMKNLGPQMTFDGADLLRKAEENIDKSKRGNQFYKISAASFELPSQLLLGVSYNKSFSDQFQAIVSTSFSNNNFSNDEYNLAVELNYNGLLFLRGGYSFVDEAAGTTEEQIFGATFGAGVKLKSTMDVTIDYGYRGVTYFNPNHIVTVKFGF